MRRYGPTLTVVFLIGGLLAAGARSDFVPSAATVRAAFGAALVLAAAWLRFSRTASGRELLAGGNPSVAKRMAHPVVGALSAVGLGLFAWFNLANTVPWLFTKALGRPGEMLVVVDGWDFLLGKALGPDCFHATLKGIPKELLGYPALCPGKLEPQPIGTRVRLVGERSPFGVAVQSVQIEGEP